MTEPWQYTIVFSSEVFTMLKYNFSRTKAPMVVAVPVRHQPRFQYSYTGIGHSYILEPIEYIGRQPHAETARTLFKLLMGVL